MPNPGAKRTHRTFPVYDNMFYIGKPDTTKYGLIPSNIIDDAHIWPHGQNYGALPSRGVFDALVAANNTNPGPIVLDIEKLPLKGSPSTIQQHLQVLATLADWTRADAPGKTVGYYGCREAQSRLMLIGGPASETNYESKHTWRPAPRKRARSRRFPDGGADSSPDDDSLLEGGGFELPVPRAMQA